MTGSKEIIRYANHVAAVTENLRGKKGAILLCRRALKSVTALLGSAHELDSAGSGEKKRILDSLLRNYHELEYALDSLFAGGFIDNDTYTRLSDEGKEFRNSVIRSITEIRAK